MIDFETVVADAERFFREAAEVADAAPTPEELDAMQAELAARTVESDAAWLAEGGMDEMPAWFGAE